MHGFVFDLFGFRVWGCCVSVCGLCLVVIVILIARVVGLCNWIRLRLFRYVHGVHLVLDFSSW